METEIIKKARYSGICQINNDDKTTSLCYKFTLAGDLVTMRDNLEKINNVLKLGQSMKGRPGVFLNPDVYGKDGKFTASINDIHIVVPVGSFASSDLRKDIEKIFEQTVRPLLTGNGLASNTLKLQIG